MLAPAVFGYMKSSVLTGRVGLFIPSRVKVFTSEKPLRGQNNNLLRIHHKRRKKETPKTPSFNCLSLFGCLPTFRSSQPPQIWNILNIPTSINLSLCILFLAGNLDVSKKE